MKIAFCLKENNFQSDLDSRFGRAEFFGFVDSRTGEELAIIENSAKNNPSGAGSAAIQLLVSNGVEAVVAPEYGPKAFESLNKLGLESYKQGSSQKTTEALTAFKNGTLEKPSAPGHGGLHKA